MKNVFGYEGPLFGFLDKFASLLWLNILWLVCCIPVFTIGASTTAMYYVALKMVKNEESYITKSFFKSFKQNFLQATVIWIALLVCAVLVALDLVICKDNTAGIFGVVNVAAYAVGFAVLLVALYVFALLAKFDNTIKNTIKNAFFISILNFPYTLIIVVFTVIPFAVAYFIPQLIPLSVFMGGSLVAYLSSMPFNKIFDKLIEKEEPEEEIVG